MTTSTLKTWHNPAMLQECAYMVADVFGHAVELGVYQGLSAKLLCELMPGRHVWLFDSFAGLPPAGKHDRNPGGHFKARKQTTLEILDGCHNYTLVEGWLADTLPQHDIHPIAFAHVDVDQESSTREAIQWLRPRMAAGGVIVLDDYRTSSCGGATKAIDELLPGVVKHKGHGGWWRAEGN